jgi:hypothetical protein
VVGAAPLHAQVSIPNIKRPIEVARKAADKTSDQIRATEKAGSGKVINAPGQAAAAQAADQQKKTAATAPQATAAAPQRGGVAPGPGSKAAPVRPPSAKDTTGLPVARRATVALFREVFSYSSGGLRDPFVSLMLSGELRPILTDLSLTGVIYDPEGRRSVALLVDGSTGEAYRVRVGQTLARMKITKIGMQDITFSIDEFGLSRSETLIIDKTKKAGAPAARRP